jgi:hypothetical protein
VLDQPKVGSFDDVLLNFLSRVESHCNRLVGPPISAPAKDTMEKRPTPKLTFLGIFDESGVSEAEFAFQLQLLCSIAAERWCDKADCTKVNASQSKPHYSDE